VSQQPAAETCEWDSLPCSGDATRHVSWQLQAGDQRHSHLCDAHAMEVLARDPDAWSRALALCNATCPVIRGRYELR